MTVNLMDISKSIATIKEIFICIFTCYTFFRITGNRNKTNIIAYALCFIIAIIASVIKFTTNSYISIICIILILSVICKLITKVKIWYTIMIMTISIALNYVIFLSTTILTFIFNKIIYIVSDMFNFVIMLILHKILLTQIFKIRKIKNGIIYLQKYANNEFLSVLVLNISVSILFLVIIITNKNLLVTRTLIPGIAIFTIIMFITIQKSLQLYYKQKVLVQELENTKKELREKTQEIEDLEKENIAISKKAHTLDHKQKSLAKKIDEMMLNTEISKDEVAEVRDRLNKIGKELYKEKTSIELAKTEIPEIDDMLKYMQSECGANKIEFELQIKGNIHYMINNLITKEDLETLLADHIKNAIIAINHTDNINRSILVRLGEIDGIYGLYIYDSGIEFEKDTLEKLGKKPSTTHKDEGGTGMGFMNTFDTLKKCKASLTIEEINEPSKENYTKAIIIKFDNKNEFKINSYR